MRTLGTSLVVAAAILGSGCSTLNVSTDYRPGTDFSVYRTFAFKDVVTIQNNIVEERIKQAVSTQLVAKGLTAKAENPDLWVVLRPRLSKETRIDTMGTGYGYGYGRWGGGMGSTTTTVQEIPVGTLVIDLVDAKANQMVWQGTASETLNASATPEAREKSINQAMAQLFAGYPPKK